MQNLTVYRLATKTKTGDVVQFGPRMSMAIAERKRKAMVAYKLPGLYR